VLNRAWVDEIARHLPELPDEKIARFMASGLTPYDASVLVAEKDVADYFDKMLAAGTEPKTAANWIVNDYFGRLNRAGLTIANGPISAERAGAAASLVASGVISSKIAKDIADIMWTDPRPPQVIVEERGLRQVTDAGAIEAAIDAIMAANPDKVAEVKTKPKLIGWFTGQAMKATQGKANPQTLNAILKRRLGLPEEG
jgi:aspartyl-tRNA(Asn)/glutamyl-tRNA(Gln) amidotransferase subunit B